jgi:curved DNA-binding protein CbpA
VSQRTCDSNHPKNSSGNTGMKDYYQILELSKEASLEEIRKQYRRLARMFHPDTVRTLSDEQRAYFEESFKDVNKAYEVLSDPEKRAEYDSTYVSQSGKLEISPSVILYFRVIELG